MYKVVMYKVVMYTHLPTEPYTRLQSAVSTLSKGPVAPSDAVGKSDVALIMRSCMADGTLLQPARPATRLDATFVEEAFGGKGTNGHVWAAASSVSHMTFTVLLAADLARSQTYQLDKVVAVESNTTDTFVKGPASLLLPPSNRFTFQVWNIAPIGPALMTHTNDANE